MTDVLATTAELEALKKAAGIPHLPTQLTFEARLAINGEGPRAYDWSDKPHRIVYDLCREIEKNAVQPDARDAALREALAAVNAKWRSGADTPDEMRGLALAEAAILDLIDKLGHVNETPKSEHDAANVLTPAKGDA